MPIANRTRSLFLALQFSLYSSPSPRKPLSHSSPRIFGFSMAGSAVDEQLEFGFQRPEMFKENLSGTVVPYARHVFLCYRAPESWPPRVEDSEADPLPKLLAGAIQARKNDLSVKTRLTTCEGGEGKELSNGDVLIFPEMIKYRGLKESEVDSFVEEVLVNGKLWASGMQEVLTGSHVFVCAHSSRDKRCGVCGPVLIEKLKEEIELRELQDQVFVSACSHVGGHKYAGNLIIFSADPEGKVSGHWYGYVSPTDVPDLLDRHIGKGEIIKRLWRGQMGAPVLEAAETAVDLKLPNGNNQEITEKEPREPAPKESKETVGGCCQGSNGFSCCKGEIQEDGGKKTSGRLFLWVRKFEQREVFSAAAVVGAVVTVAVVYGFYKRSR